MAYTTERSGLRVLPILLGLLVIGFMAVRGCQEGPFGRKQIVAMNPQQESQLGAQAFQEVLGKSQVVRGGEIVESVDSVVQRLVQATRNADFVKNTKLNPKRYADFQWAVRVVRSREINAFCLPGGKMVVYTGILPVCKTDAGLATVMGHEIGHALASHGAERMAQQQMAQVGVSAAGASLGDMSTNQRYAIMRAINAGASFGILSYSRAHESEADRIGLYLMAVAGYDPRASVKFWERMESSSKGGRPPEFLSTHPSHETRIRDLQRWMPEALKLFKARKNPAPDDLLPAISGR